MMTSRAVTSASLWPWLAYATARSGSSAVAIRNRLVHSIPTRPPRRRSPRRSPSTSSVMRAQPDRTDIPHLDVDAARPPLEAAQRPAAGVLMLIGGALTRDGHALRSFVDLVNERPRGTVVGLTTASAEPEENGWYWAGVL